MTDIVPPPPSGAVELPVTSLAEHRVHLESLLLGARRELVIQERDPCLVGLESQAACDILRTFLSEPGQRRVRLLLTGDVRAFERDCPRLLRLLDTLSHRFEIRVADPRQLARDESAWALADDDTLLMRFHAERARGKFVRHDGGAVARLRARFEDDWLASRPGPTGSALGL